MNRLRKMKRPRPKQRFFGPWLGVRRLGFVRSGPEKETTPRG